MRVRRALVIGLDGATLDLIAPWAKAGHLPVLRGLMSKGSYGRLRSVYPVLSSAAWTSFMTGMNPGKHGVYDFVARKEQGYSLRPVTRQHISGQSLWRILTEDNLRVGVINVPMTYPPEQVNGFLVSGLGTPDGGAFTHPRELGDRLLLDGYRVNRKAFHRRAGDEEAFLSDTYEISERLTQTALRLIRDEPWDFFTVVYRDTDEIGHAFWGYMDESHPSYDPLRGQLYGDAILDCYRRLDRSVGELIAAAGPDTAVFIISDHGTGPLYKDVFLNEWLRQQGFLFLKPPKATRRALARLGITRANVSRVLRSLGLSRVEFKIKSWLGQRIGMLPRDKWGDFAEVIDWSRTRAYSFGYHGQIYTNLAGREPQGTVASGMEFERVRRELVQALHAWIDPDDGQPVVSAVYTASELYHGPRVDRAPDLVVVMRDLAYITRQGYEFGYRPNVIFSDPLTGETGGHRLDGVLIASGAGLAQLEGESPPASLMDIAPTVLHLLGCPVPDDMDGRVLKDWLALDWRARPVATYRGQQGAPDAQQEDDLSAQEEQELLDRLRNLGYVE